MQQEALKELSWNDVVTMTSPHPYVLATSVGKEGKGNIVGLGWWTICSWSPPMVAISLGEKRFSLGNIERGGDFVLCFVGEEHARGAWVCGTKSGRTCDKFEEAGFTAVPSAKVKSPTIGESLVALECVVKGRLVTGDHVLLAGEIVAMRGAGREARHLYSIHYTKLVALGPDGSANAEVKFK